MSGPHRDPALAIKLSFALVPCALVPVCVSRLHPPTSEADRIDLSELATNKYAMASTAHTSEQLLQVQDARLAVDAMLKLVWSAQEDGSAPDDRTRIVTD